MASPTQETPPTGDASAKKKIRPNPARRKASKVKSETQSAQLGTPPPVPEQTTTNTAVAKLSKPIVPATAGSPASKPLTRTETTPATAPVPTKQSPQPAPASQKPSLTRTKTAPTSGSKAKSLALTAPALVTGGLVGCAAGAAILLGVGIWYDFSGAESAILAARAAKLCVDNLSEELITSLKSGTYSSDEALDMLRRTTLAYASTIPEGAPFVERVFREIDMVRKQRGREIDRVVAETYAQLAKAGIKGASSAEMRAIVFGQMMKLSTFASKATQDVVARNPKLRPFRDETVRSLQGPREGKVPTLRVNMAVRQKLAGGT